MIMTQAVLQDRVQTLLQNAELSESELARRINIPRATLNRLVAGRMANPKMHVLNAIAQYFDLTFDELMLGASSKGISPIQAISLPLVPWEKQHLPTLASQFPLKSWLGPSPPQGAYITYLNEKRHDYFPNHKQMLLISPHAKPKPGQLIVLRFHEKRVNVIGQMLLTDQQFYFKGLHTQSHEMLQTGSYQFIGCIQQVVQGD